MRSMAMTVLASLGAFACLALGAQSADPSLPNAGRTVALPFGQVDAISGDFSASVPLGPRMPGRIGAGFNWSFDVQSLSARAVQGGQLEPVTWPRLLDPNTNLLLTVQVNGQSLNFYPQATNLVPQSPSYWQSLFAARGVALQSPNSNQAPPLSTILGSTFHCTVYPSSDGTKFLVSYAYSTEVARTTLPGATTQTMEMNGGFVVIDGPKAIWTQCLGILPSLPMPQAEMGQTYATTHITNLWGDEIDMTESFVGQGASAPLPTGIVISDPRSQASISLSIIPTSAPTVGTQGWMPNNSDNMQYYTSFITCPATVTIRASFGDASFPEVTLKGVIDGHQRFSNGNLSPTVGPTGAWDWGFQPSSIQETASDGTSSTTTLGWSQVCTTQISDVEKGGFMAPITISVPSGLVQTLGFEFTLGDLSRYSYDPSSGLWIGWSPKPIAQVTRPSNFPQTFISRAGGDLLRSQNLAYPDLPGVCLITLADPSDPTPTKGQSILISRVMPQYQFGGMTNGGYLFNETQSQHVTTILRYGTSAPTSQSPYRGTRLMHLSLNDMGSNWAGLSGYLFATSAVVQEDQIVGTDGPSSFSAPAGWQPSSPTTVRTTVYDGFSLASWVNPSGALGTALPVTAVARRTTVYTPSSSLFPGGLPTKVTLAGDPGNPAASDAYGPTQTDEWTGPQQAAPAWTSVAGSGGSGGTLAASAVNSGNSALSNGVHRQGLIQRHFDGSMVPSATAGTGTMRLLTDTDQKTLDGGALPSLRGVSSVDFGTTSYKYDGLGRVKEQDGTRGAFTATETRTFNGNLPQIADTTKALSQGGTPLYANPADPTVVVGTHSTFDTTPYQWTQTVTDKVDGRPATILTRDGYGRVKAQKDVLGIETDTSYDPWGRVETVTRQPHTNGGSTVGSVTTTTTITADNRHRTDTVTEGDTGRVLTTTTDFDAFGRKTHITLPDGRTQSFQYDGFGELVVQSPLLAPGETPYGYETWKVDALGRVTDHLDALGHTLMHVVQPPGWGTAGGVTGIVTTTQDDRGYTRTEVTDLLGQKAAIVDQAGQLSTFSYDQDGHLIGTNQSGQTRAYTYNDMGWLTSRTEPEEGSTTYGGFTMLGTPLSSTQSGRSGASALTTSTTLNHHLQPSQISSTFGGQTVMRTLTYDDAGTHLLTGVTETQANGTLTESYPVATAYDGLYRLIQKAVSDGIQTFAVGQSLDAVGRQTNLTYPSAAGRTDQVVNSYDSLGRLATVTLNGESQPTVSMVYDQVQQSGMAVVNTLTFGNGAWTSSASVQGKLANVTHVAGTIVENDLITWTPGGLMLSRGGDSWAYDALQRLATASIVNPQDGSTVTQGFTYDPWGNRATTTTTYGGASPTLKEGLSWSVASTDGRNSLPTFVTAPSGNLPTGVLYDDLGRMTQVDGVPGQPSTLMTWVYDAAGRVAQENGTRFLLDSGGLRFRRAHADGSVTYTVYGFHGEPLSVFAQAAPAQTTTATQASTVRTAMMPVGGGGNPPPATTITITSPASGVTVWTGVAVPFVATASGTVVWAFGDGGTATGATATHAYSTPGTYIVSGSAYAAMHGTTTVTITVTVVAPPVIGSFTALPSTIPAGQSTTLSWNLTNTTSVAINGATQPSGSTSLVVTPSGTTVYTLTASNAGGSVTASLTMTVGQEIPAAIQAFAASPSTGITAGSPVSLSWATTNATSLSLDNGIGTVTGTSVSVSPLVTTTYTLTAQNAFGASTQQVTVLVISTPTAAPVIGSFTASAGTIAAGSSCDLAWQVSGASSVSLSSVGIVNGTGHMSVTPSGTTTYTLTASNAAGTTTKTLTVTVATGPVLVWQKTMVYGFGQELREEQASGGTVFIQSDQVGSPNLMTDAALALVGRTKTLPYGEALYQSGASSIRRYTNHESSEGNAIYMQARMYLQAYGKFAETDPAYDQAKGDPESWNLYNYTTNNPITHTDADGRSIYYKATPYRTGNDWLTTGGEDSQVGDTPAPNEGDGGSSLRDDAHSATDTPSDPCVSVGAQSGGEADPPSTSANEKAPTVETDSTQTKPNPGKSTTRPFRPSNGDPAFDVPASTKVGDVVVNPANGKRYSVTADADKDGFRKSEEQKASIVVWVSGVGTALAKPAVGVTTIGTNLKIYKNGWRGGSRARIKTYSLAESADLVGTGLFGLGVLLDGYQYYNGDIGGFEFSANTVVGLSGFVEPAIPVIYWGYQEMDDNGRAPKDSPARYVRGVGFR